MVWEFVSLEYGIISKAEIECVQNKKENKQQPQNKI